VDRRSFALGALLMPAALPGSRAIAAGGASGGGITRQDFQRYIDAFNRGDFDTLGEYYAADVDFRGQGGQFRGRQAVLDFYRGVKHRVHETLSIQELVVGERAILVDLLTELQVLEDWPDFPRGALHRGETRRSENFIWYDIEDHHFKRVRSAHYGAGAAPPTDSSAAQPRAVASPAQDRAVVPAAHDQEPAMSEARFRAYIDAFNRDDYSEFAQFYAEDVVLVLAGKRELRGRQAIIDYYRVVKAQTRRTIHVDAVILDPHRIGAELHSEFLALEDLPHFIAGPMRRGGRIFINTFVLYDLRDGRFARIRSAEFRKVNEGIAAGR